MRLTRVLEAINRPDVRMIQRGEHLRFTLETGKAIGIPCKGVRQHLQRDLTIQLRVARAIHLAHAAGSKGGKDLVRAKSRARGEGQTLSDYTVRPPTGTGLLLSDAAVLIGVAGSEVSQVQNFLRLCRMPECLKLP